MTIETTDMIAESPPALVPGDEKARGGATGGMLGGTAGAAGGIGLATAVGNITIYVASIPPEIASDVQTVITWTLGLGFAAVGGRYGAYHGTWHAQPNSTRTAE